MLRWGEATDEPAREDARTTKGCKTDHHPNSVPPSGFVPACRMKIMCRCGGNRFDPRSKIPSLAVAVLLHHHAALLVAA